MPQPAVTDLEAKEPIESTDPNEPTEPIERADPFEAIERTESSDQMLIEPLPASALTARARPRRSVKTEPA